MNDFLLHLIHQINNLEVYLKMQRVDKINLKSIAAKTGNGFLTLQNGEHNLKHNSTNTNTNASTMAPAVPIRIQPTKSSPAVKLPKLVVLWTKDRDNPTKPRNSNDYCQQFSIPGSCVLTRNTNGYEVSSQICFILKFIDS